MRLSNDLGIELGRKIVSDMFYSGELEKEKEWLFKSVGDLEKYMAATDEERASTLYQHTTTTGCIEKGVTCLCYVIALSMDMQYYYKNCLFIQDLAGVTH